jgi:hypothetical protein
MCRFEEFYLFIYFFIFISFFVIAGFGGLILIFS